ncbi:hypothetical protein HA402_012668 [Bradysia odoriphaga]|nr:hypothetical protein HA402_012668 [Bradysia odoriphaga]
MQLAVINSAVEQSIVADMKNQSEYRNSGFWISGNDLACQKHWYWSSNGHPIKYFSWQRGEPNNAKKNERCIKMNPKTSLWNDDPCEYPNHYICEESLIKATK